MKKSLLVLLTIVVVMSAMIMGSVSADAVTENGYSYTVENGEATIIGCEKNKEGAITVPSTLGGYPVTSIAYGAFMSCKNITSVVIPEGIKTISNTAFMFAEKITTVSVPASVKSIGKQAFSRCDALLMVNVAAGNTAYTSVNGILFNKDKTTILHYPAGKTDTSYTIPSTVTRIEANAFSNCLNLKDIDIPSSVQSIGYNAFYDCGMYNISGNWTRRSLIIDSCLVAINYTASSYYVDEGVKCIADSVFIDFANLKYIELPESLEYVGAGAFQSCENLQSVDFLGSKSQWSKVVIAENNENLLNATITCLKADVPAKNGWIEENGIWYYYENDAKVKNDWRKDNTGWCFLDADGKWVLNAFVKDSTGKWAYITPDGYYYESTKWVEYKGNWYYLEKGYRVENDWRKDSTGWCFLNEDGIWVLNCFVKDSTGKWAYITKDGYYYETTGWVQLGKDWYYLEKGYAVTNDWRKDSTGWCYLSSTGAMVTNNFVKDSAGLAYITKDGYFYETVSGWQLVGGEWYYVEKGYAVTNTWREDSQGWCYLSASGAMVTNGWVKDSTGWCFLDASGYWDGKYYSTPSQTTVTNGVWIPTVSGTKYHSTSTCSNMIDPVCVSVEDAIARGFTKCKKCS